MSPTDASDQVKFLVCCIGHTTNGRVRSIPRYYLKRPSANSKNSPISSSWPTSSRLSPRRPRKFSPAIPLSTVTYLLPPPPSQKRYERLLKSYGIKPGANNNSGSTPAAAEKKPVANRTPRKRKAATNSNNSDDDGSSLAATPAAKKRARVAASKRSKKEDVAVEDAEDDEINRKTEGIRESRESSLSGTFGFWF